MRQTALGSQHVPLLHSLVLALLLSAPVGNASALTIGNIDTVAGTGQSGFNGDNQAATSAQLNLPSAIAIGPNGRSLFIADAGNNRIRLVDSPGGILTSVAGGRPAFFSSGYAGDGGPATAAQLFNPDGVALDASGSLLIADKQNNRIRKVDSGGIITTVAGASTGLLGFGSGGYAGDGGLATAAQLSFPTGVALDASGNLFIADGGNNRIRKVAAGGTKPGIITTVAGGGTSGLGDGGLATSAQLNQPFGVALDAAGNLFIADAANNRIRKVAAGTGIITTVAGGGTSGLGDGGLATAAQLSFPTGVALDASGNLFIADVGNYRIRKVAAGIITTVAGTGTAGFNGDNQAATSAQLNYPTGVALDASGNLFICEYFNHRIRRVIGAGMGTRPLILAPADQARIGLGESLALQWTEVAGAIAYGVEYTGPGLQFTNTNGMLPDRTNGFGGAGGVLFVYNIFTSMGVNPVATPGSYQFRVIGLKGDGTAAGTYSDAITVVVQ